MLDKGDQSRVDCQKSVSPFLLYWLYLLLTVRSRNDLWLVRHTGVSHTDASVRNGLFLERPEMLTTLWKYPRKHIQRQQTNDFQQKRGEQNCSSDRWSYLKGKNWAIVNQINENVFMTTAVRLVTPTLSPCCCREHSPGDLPRFRNTSCKSSSVHVCGKSFAPGGQV